MSTFPASGPEVGEAESQDVVVLTVQLSVPPPEFEIPICFVTGNLVPATPFSARLAG